MLCLFDSSYQNINLRFVFYFIILTEYSIKMICHSYSNDNNYCSFAEDIRMALFGLHVLGCVGLLL